jgi:hypothetical protein
MKAYLSKKDFPLRKAADNNHPLDIHYSKTEFFYEGQECRSEDEETNANEEKVNTKNKKRNHFRGNFNIFF